MFVQKQYRSAFVVEKSKLTRLLDVIKEKLAQPNMIYGEAFEAHLAGIKTVSSDTITQIFDLDNSERSRIERLVITCVSSTEEEDEEPKHAIKIDFDGHKPVDVTIEVKSDDSKLASDLMSVAEEQVERMLEQNAMSWLFGRHEFLLLILLSVTFFIFAIPISHFESQLPKAMWLTPNDCNRSVTLYFPRLELTARRGAKHQYVRPG